MGDYHFIERKGAEAGSPLLLTFHGTGGDERQFFDFASQLLPEAHVISPRGDVSEGGALRFFRRTGEGVYDMDDLARRTAAMAEFISELRASAPEAKVIGLGYSNGANILASVMMANGGLVDKAVLMHPLIPFTPADQPALEGRDILITAGRQDPICPAPMTEQLITWLEGQGAAVKPVWHAGGHEIRPEEVTAVQEFLASYR